MIKPAQGNIIESKVEALVNTVNCVGVMGRGVALQFRQAFPENYKAYKAACDKRIVNIGEMFITEMSLLEHPRLIINFPTKRHWREKSKIEYIESGLIDLVEMIKQHKVRSIAVPPLGCGLGGLDWSEVRPKIVEALETIDDLSVQLFEPIQENITKSTNTINRTEPPKMTPASAILLVLMGRYLAGLMDPFISLLEIHKLMYFMQEAGQPLKLKFSTAQYGPYAENLRHVLIRLDNHFISGYGDGHDNPRKPLDINRDALVWANEFIDKNSEIQTRFERVQKVIDGFETPIGMELLSTVHWVVNYQGAKNSEETIARVYAWNDRKKTLFSEKHINIAWESLHNQGWLNLT